MIKGIMPTEKGMYIIDALEKTVPDMLSVDMTSDMEMELDKIARGKSDGNDFLNNYKKLVAKWVELIKTVILLQWQVTPLFVRYAVNL